MLLEGESEVGESEVGESEVGESEVGEPVVGEPVVGEPVVDFVDGRLVSLRSVVVSLRSVAKILIQISIHEVPTVEEPPPHPRGQSN